MLRIGLTGGIGSGKSSVARMFDKLGVPVIDTDRISHQLTTLDTDCIEEIHRAFGAEVITKDGKLDRKMLANVVFSDPQRKKTLEDILHPRIRQKMLEMISGLGDTAYVILVVPLLFETDFIELVDRVLVVNASEETRVQRVMHRDQRSEQQIRDILKNQIDQATKIDKADDVLENNGSLGQLQSAVEQLHDRYLRMAAGDFSG